MKVIVEIITGTFMDMELSKNASVKELKEKIAAKVKLPMKRLILVVEDEEMRRVVMETEEDMMLRNLGLGEYSHVYLFFKHLDLVSSEGRSQGEEGDDNPMEEISSKAVEEKAKIDGEEEDEAMKDEEKDEDKKEKIAEKEKYKDDVKEEARDGEECDNKEETYI